MSAMSGCPLYFSKKPKWSYFVSPHFQILLLSWCSWHSQAKKRIVVICDHPQNWILHYFQSSSHSSTAAPPPLPVQAQQLVEGIAAVDRCHGRGGGGFHLSRPNEATDHAAGRSEVHLPLERGWNHVASKNHQQWNCEGSQHFTARYGKPMTIMTYIAKMPENDL